MAAIYAGIIGLGLLGAVSDATLNQWAETNRAAWLAASYGLWIAVATIFGLLLKSDSLNFAVIVVIFLMANSAFAVLLDRWWFEGTMTAGQWAGIGFAMAAVLCFELGRTNSAS